MVQSGLQNQNFLLIITTCIRIFMKGTTPREFKPNRKVNSKIDDEIKKYLYNWIMHHQHILRSPIVNDCLKWTLMVTLDHKLFKICYCRSPSKNFVTDLLVNQKMVVSNRQEMHRIISLSVILHYIHYCHPNLEIFQ